MGDIYENEEYYYYIKEGKETGIEFNKLVSIMEQILQISKVVSSGHWAGHNIIPQYSMSRLAVCSHTKNKLSIRSCFFWKVILRL